MRKNIWGRKLAAGLDYEFIDLDHVLEAKVGSTIADFFASHGETNFRRLEFEILRTTDYPENTVISTGAACLAFLIICSG